MKSQTITCPHCGGTAATITIAAATAEPDDASPLAQFLRAQCRLVPGARTPTVDFHAAFRSWVAAHVHIQPPSPKLVGTELRRYSVRVSKSNGRKYYSGVDLRPMKSDPA